MQERRKHLEICREKLRLLYEKRKILIRLATNYLKEDRPHNRYGK
jgi:hypothetical protein